MKKIVGHIIATDSLQKEYSALPLIRHKREKSLSD